MRCRAQQIERQLGELGSADSSRAHYIASSQAHRHAWNGRFGEAHRLFGSVLDRQALEADRIMVHALYALTLALDGQVKQSALAAEEALALIDRSKSDASYGALLLESAPRITGERVRPAPGDGAQDLLPSPLNPPSGCRFRTRCPLATEKFERRRIIRRDPSTPIAY